MSGTVAAPALRAHPSPAPPLQGGAFGTAAVRLAGLAGVVFGWPPDAFWRATPAELGALVAALRGEDAVAPPDAGAIARLKERFPDGG